MGRGERGRVGRLALPLPPLFPFSLCPPTFLSPSSIVGSDLLGGMSQALKFSKKNKGWGKRGGRKREMEGKEGERHLRLSRTMNYRWRNTDAKLNEGKFMSERSKVHWLKNKEKWKIKEILSPNWKAEKSDLKNKKKQGERERENMYKSRTSHPRYFCLHSLLIKAFPSRYTTTLMAGV